VVWAHDDKEETSETRASIERNWKKRQAKETMDGWSASRSGEIRSNGLGGKDPEL